MKKSVTPDYIICLEDGKKLKMLKRYLRARHGLTPEAYRAKWNLPADYPMVAPNYAQRRSDFAKGERDWVDALSGIVADNAELLVRGEDASFQNKLHLAMDGKGFGEPKASGPPTP